MTTATKDGTAFKIPYGEQDGSPTHISKVERGLRCDCVCPACKEPLVARKGEVKAHHFAHYPGPNCSAETVLHTIGKALLYQRILEALTDHRPLPMSWNCTLCFDRHEGNLVKNITAVSMERSLGSIRPDLTLLDADGSPKSIVEVVVTHKPEESVLAYVGEHGIALAEFHVASSYDLEVIEGSPALEATKTTICLRPKCNQCHDPLDTSVLHIVKTFCHVCSSIQRVAIVALGDPHPDYLWPEDFSEKEVALAREHGARLKQSYSRTLGRTYLANACECGAFLGNFYLGAITEGGRCNPATAICETGFTCGRERAGCHVEKGKSPT